MARCLDHLHQHINFKRLPIEIKKDIWTFFNNPAKCWTKIIELVKDSNKLSTKFSSASIQAFDGM